MNIQAGVNLSYQTENFYEEKEKINKFDRKKNRNKNIEINNKADDSYNDMIFLNNRTRDSTKFAKNARDVSKQ